MDLFKDLKLEFNEDIEKIELKDGNGEIIKSVITKLDTYLQFSVGDKKYKIKCEEIKGE